MNGRDCKKLAAHTTQIAWFSDRHRSQRVFFHTACLNLLICRYRSGTKYDVSKVFEYDNEKSWVEMMVWRRRNLVEVVTWDLE